MSEATSSLRSPPLTSVISRLARLRWQVTASLWVAGLARVLWLGLLLAAADFLIDWTFRLDLTQRAVLAALVAGLIGYGVYRWLALPLSRSLNDEVLALQIERANPNLRQALITAVQLGKQSDARRRGMSPALVSRAIAHGAELAERIGFEGIMNRAAQRRNLLAAAAAMLVLLGLAAAAVTAAPIKIWFARNVLLREVNWPQNTYLVIENLRPDGTVVFPRGMDWTQEITVREDSRVIPQEVYLEVQAGAGIRSRALAETSAGRFSASFTRVTEPFEFRVRGGDEVSDWVRVELVDPPALTTLKLYVTPPPYAGGVREELLAGQGPYAVLAGSELHVQATANKELVRATLLAEGRPLATGGGSDLNEAFQLAIGRGSELSASIAAKRLLVGAYRFELEDALGFREREPIAFALQKRLDQAPRVSVRLPATRGMVTPEARIPFECESSDDFGLTGLGAVLRSLGPGEQAAAERTVDFRAQLADALVAVGQPASLREVQLNNALDFTAFPDQAGIQPGGSLQIVFEAADNDDQSGPNIGRSAVFSLRVVTPEELRADLLRREKELRQVFQQAVQDQEALVVESRAQAAALAGEPEAIRDARQQLAEMHRRQKELGRSTSEMADRFAKIALEVQNNRLEDDTARLQTRLTKEIVEPLREAKDVIEAALVELDRARWAETADEQKSALAAASQRQSDAATAMRAVLRHMIETESFQEAVNMLLEIQKAQAALHEQTNKAREDRIRRLLEGDRGTGSNEGPNR
jgi:hypothetical protein